MGALGEASRVQAGQHEAWVLKVNLVPSADCEAERHFFFFAMGSKREGYSMMVKSLAWVLSLNPDSAICLLSDHGKCRYSLCDSVWSPVRWGGEE